MSFDFDNNIPIYLQIIDYFKMQIISKKYVAGEKIPSVRELSMQFEVNPNTIQKALGELENMGLIFTERTNGKFVTNNLEVINKLREETVKNMINNFYESMERLGLSKNEILEILNRGEKK